MRGKNNGNIVLIGFMGAGKTETGRALAINGKLNFMDTDFIIEKLEGMTISEIFAASGENYFRSLENNLLKKISNGKEGIALIIEECGLAAGKSDEEGLSTGNAGAPWVIATGGGMPAFNGNMELLNKTGISFYLKADPETIYERIMNESHRPVLGTAGKFNLKDISEKLSEREKYYIKSDIIIYTEGLSINAAAEEIGIFMAALKLSKTNG